MRLPLVGIEGEGSAGEGKEAFLVETVGAVFEKMKVGGFPKEDPRDDIDDLDPDGIGEERADEDDGGEGDDTESEEDKSKDGIAAEGTLILLTLLGVIEGDCLTVDGLLLGGDAIGMDMNGKGIIGLCDVGAGFDIGSDVLTDHGIVTRGKWR